MPFGCIDNHTLLFAGSGLTLWEGCHSTTLSPFILEQKEALQRSIDEVLGTDGVLLYPSHPVLAQKHHHPLFTPFNIAYTGDATYRIST